MFTEWLETFITEKGLDRDQLFMVEGPVWGLNIIPFECVLDAVKSASASVGLQEAIWSTLVLMDFFDADINEFFQTVAEEMAL